jgi:branched-chain amino acid transport system ATP-binding protein
MSEAAILTVDGLGKRFGGFVALAALGFEVRRGERIGLIGPNGAGKSTLVNCISGLLRCDSGRLLFDGADITLLAPHRRTRLGIARSFQIPRPFASMTLLENVAIPLEYAAASRRRRGEVLDEAAQLLTSLGLAAKQRRLPGSLGQIELRKLELARALAARPKLLMADEVMAGLSSAEVDEILAILFRLNAEGITIIMIEHIMRAVMRFSTRLVVLNAGRKIAEGAPDEVIADKAVEQAYLGV